ncbi:hypothetical protein E5676_scaffold218G00180 [Cucumis melo var. makuwa]|uniref:Uncharacterized protein n=3 Tax=Cucumis melo TaxID=3656 RepID=A0A5A7V756_CUCMM|nr:hypothetical protein E6C27_scaffold548G001440 [Cucumis melo var. makuwa]TYK02826.1 hypothetical protein E5676_scaffold218G00180 [Cucumis melo var. makuwa]
MKKKTLKEQFRKWQDEKAKRKPQNNEGEEGKESDSEKPLSFTKVSKQFMIEKGLYPYQRAMPGFLTIPIQAFKWKRFFQGVIAIIPDVVKMFYKGYINEEEHYVTVKG